MLNILCIFWPSLMKRRPFRDGMIKVWIIDLNRKWRGGELVPFSKSKFSSFVANSTVAVERFSPSLNYKKMNKELYEIPCSDHIIVIWRNIEGAHIWQQLKCGVSRQPRRLPFPIPILCHSLPPSDMVLTISKKINALQM